MLKPTSAESRSSAADAGIDRARERLERALDAAAQGVVICDARGELVFQNERASSMMPPGGAEILTRTTVIRLLRSANAGAAAAETLELYGPPRRTLELSANPLASDTDGIGAVVVIEDVTEKRLHEAVRRDFVANISHELKTPVGALGLLAETLPGEDDPEVVNRLARRIQGEAQRLGRIMDDLFDLSRIESQVGTANIPVPVHVIVVQAVERVRSAAEHRGITLHIEEHGEETVVNGDRHELVSALYNLLENAVKYSDPGAAVDVCVRTDGEWTELHVEDHGIGIPSRDLERIFERFYRVDRARGRDTGGTGLGLAIVRHVASNHAGEVRVRSQEGVGSSFTLRLPIRPRASAAPGDARENG